MKFFLNPTCSGNPQEAAFQIIRDQLFENKIHFLWNISNQSNRVLLVCWEKLNKKRNCIVWVESAWPARPVLWVNKESVNYKDELKRLTVSSENKCSVVAELELFCCVGGVCGMGHRARPGCCQSNIITGVHRRLGIYYLGLQVYFLPLILTGNLRHRSAVRTVSFIANWPSQLHLRLQKLVSLIKFFSILQRV